MGENQRAGEATSNTLLDTRYSMCDNMEYIMSDNKSETLEFTNRGICPKCGKNGIKCDTQPQQADPSRTSAWCDCGWRGAVPTVERPVPGFALIAMERHRQITEKGYTAEHDDKHDGTEFLQAAACYMANATPWDFGLSDVAWPWESEDYKPSPDYVRNLVKAGALIAAEIDRLQRKGVV